MATTHDPSSILPSAPPSTESLLLRDLAQRIRALRKSRSLTRKNLSQLADVSERHLAQLESGEGNISILLLNRIATALNTSLAELFASNDELSSSNENLTAPETHRPHRPPRRRQIHPRRKTRRHPQHPLHRTRSRNRKRNRHAPRRHFFALRTIRLSRHRTPHTRARHQRIRPRSLLHRRRCRHRIRNLRLPPRKLLHRLDQSETAGTHGSRRRLRATSAQWQATTARWTISAVFSIRANRSIAKPT